MSSRLLEIGITNTIFALLIATVVLLIARWRPNAHWEAVLWLAVLLRFVMPPVMPFSVALPAVASTEGPPTALTPDEAQGTPISLRTSAGSATEISAASRDHVASSPPGGSQAAARLPAAPEIASNSPSQATPPQHSMATVKSWLLSRWTVDSLARIGLVWIWLGWAGPAWRRGCCSSGLIGFISFLAAARRARPTTNCSRPAVKCARPREFAAILGCASSMPRFRR